MQAPATPSKAAYEMYEAVLRARLGILAILQRFSTFLQQIIRDTAQVLFHGKERWIIT